jgi:hypothetical protein
MEVAGRLSAWNSEWYQRACVGKGYTTVFGWYTYVGQLVYCIEARLRVSVAVLLVLLAGSV